jgi:hypothetical protein
MRTLLVPRESGSKLPHSKRFAMLRRARIGFVAAVWGLPALLAQPFHFPTANHALLENGGGEAFFVGTPGQPWTTGAFGGVRSEGQQLHEGLDIRCLDRDQAGEPTDPVLATADGAVAYFSANPALSNYGRYVILRHFIEGVEVYSLYAHLREVRSGLETGQSVQAGEPIGVMGRSSNTGQRISKERAHVHFELDLRLSDRFTAWQKQAFPGQRNDHGEWNGRNLVAFDPAQVFKEQASQGTNFSLLRMLREQTELCRVLVRATNFAWVRRYAALVEPNPKAEQEGVAGYELALNFNGLAYRVIPRAASEIKGAAKFQLLSVNEAEQRARPCGHLVTKRRGRWELQTRGLQLLELLTY